MKRFHRGFAVLVFILSMPSAVYDTVNTQKCQATSVVLADLKVLLAPASKTPEVSCVMSHTGMYHAADLGKLTRKTGIPALQTGGMGL